MGGYRRRTLGSYANHIVLLAADSLCIHVTSLLNRPMSKPQPSVHVLRDSALMDLRVCLLGGAGGHEAPFGKHIEVAIVLVEGVRRPVGCNELLCASVKVSCFGEGKDVVPFLAQRRGSGSRRASMRFSALSGIETIVVVRALRWRGVGEDESRHSDDVRFAGGEREVSSGWSW